MRITIEKLQGWNVALDAARYTIWKDPLNKEPSESFKRQIIESEHSPLRCVTFKIEMIGIPTCVSVHFVRHKFGVEHFVSSNREDRNGGNTEIDRWSPVNHMMIVNAQELLFMARRRLCRKAMSETREVMEEICNQIKSVDSVLAEYMVPMCVYRGACHEIEPCNG